MRLSICVTVVVVAVSCLTSSATHAQSVLRGRVVDVRGHRPVADAVVEAAGRSVRSNTDGSFRLDSLRSGVVSITARALGFAPQHAVLALGAADTLELEITMPRAPPALESVRVEGERAPLVAGKLRDFERRRRVSSGGTFLTRADLEAFRDLRMKDGLRRVAGLSLARRPWKCGGGFAAAVGRSPGKQPESFCAERREWYPNACYLSVFVDGRRVWAPGEPDPPNIDEFRASDLEALEVYRGANLPAELGGTGAICGAVVIWTRVGGD